MITTFANIAICNVYPIITILIVHFPYSYKLFLPTVKLNKCNIQKTQVHLWANKQLLVHVQFRSKEMHITKCLLGPDVVDNMALLVTRFSQISHITLISDIARFIG